MNITDFKNLNKYLLLINFFFLQSYLLRFNLPILNFSYPTNLQEILIISNLLVFFISKLQVKKINFIEILKQNRIIIFIILLSIGSIILNPIYQMMDLLRNIKFLFFGSILTIITLNTFDQPKEIKNLLNAYGLGAILFGLGCILYNSLGYNMTYDLRLRGFLDSAVYLGYYLAPAFIYFSIEFFEQLKTDFNKVNFITKKVKIYMLSAIATGLLLLATKSMGAIGGSIICVFIYLLISYKTYILESTIIKTILVTIIAILFGSIFYLKILPTLNTTYSSLDERGEIWKTSAHILKEPRNLLLGVGLGQFEHHYIQNVETVLNNKPLDYFVLQPHNLFLLFIFNYGLLGLLLLVCILRELIIHINDYRKSNKLHTNHLISIILIYFFIHGMIDTPIYKNDLIILFLLFSQYIFNLEPNHKKYFI